MFIFFFDFFFFFVVYHCLQHLQTLCLNNSELRAYYQCNQINLNSWFSFLSLFNSFNFNSKFNNAKDSFSYRHPVSYYIYVYCICCIYDDICNIMIYFVSRTLHVLLMVYFTIYYLLNSYTTNITNLFLSDCLTV